jgi:predicted TPR repeat methyltransferase
MKAGNWEQMETAADLACGTGRIGMWLKEHAVRLLDGVDLTEAMLGQAHAKGIYHTLQLADLRQTPLGAHSYDLVSVGLAGQLRLSLATADFFLILHW